MAGRYEGAVWRLPTKDEVERFMRAASVEPGYDLRGACWTSTPYEGSEETGWFADFKAKPSFERFNGTHRTKHGFRYACIRLVTEVCDIDPGRESRLENDGECWVDHFTGLAWRLSLIDENGKDTDDPREIWVDVWTEAPCVVDRFNRAYAKRKPVSKAVTVSEVEAMGIRRRRGEPTLILVPGPEVSEDQKSFEDIADEYWVYLNDLADGGCIVYGRFASQWKANPSLRWPLAELARRHLSNKA